MKCQFTTFIMNILILIVLVCINQINSASLDCYWNAELKYKYFSSKTPYENVRGDIRDSIVTPKGCEPISVWVILRHGKRNPGILFLEGIRDVLKLKDYIISSYKNGNSTLCAQDVENLRNWKTDASLLDKPSEISDEGYQELIRIGNRLREALPELLNNLQENDYLFHTTFIHRMQESAEAFVEGLQYKNLQIEKVRNGDSTAAPYIACGKYQTEVVQKPNIHYTEFMKTADYQNMKARIERRLGLYLTFTNEDIISMHDVCHYTWKGIENKPSPWCALFSAEDLKVLEYVADLRLYYRSGYGVANYSSKFGQLVLANLLAHLKLTKDGRGKKIVTHFTHSAMLHMIVVALDLYKDVNGLSVPHRDVNRKWRSTFISPFSGNMMAILNRCTNYNGDGNNHKVAFYLNEKPLLELCKEGICSWEELEDKFQLFLNATTDFCEFKWIVN